MKYACFGYFDEEKFAKVPEAQALAMMDDCIAYDDAVIRGGGYWAGGEGLQSPKNTTTLRSQNGKVTVTDGPFIETKEQVGGLMFLEAKDLNEAIRLISNHPGLKMGPWEIRPVTDLNAMIKASQERREAGGQHA